MIKTDSFPKKWFFKCLLLVSLILAFSFQNAGFKATQIKYKKVKGAYDTKWEGLKKLLREKEVNTDDFEVLIRSFKYEKELEVWCRSKGTKAYTLVKTIPICASSGVLGPKRRQGDGQVPEGFYEVSWFNPMSDYHLGLKINYPNASDRKKASARDPGGEIMIHGNCVTIGCIPLQDDPIEELYVLCVESKNKDHELPVHIFPFRMEEKNWNAISKKDTNEEKKKFWSSLRSVYLFFEENNYVPTIKITKEGDYEMLRS